MPSSVVMADMKRHPHSGKPVVKNLNYYVEGRAFEWTMSLSMFFGGLQLVFWPNSMHDSAFGYITTIFPTHTLTYVLILIGWVRGCALMLNGQRVWGIKLGPYTRAIFSVVSATVWAQFTIALIELSITQGYPSPGMPFWAMFTLGEVYTSYTTVKNG